MAQLVSAAIVASAFQEAFQGTLPAAHLKAVASYIKAQSENGKHYPATGTAKEQNDGAQLFQIEPTDLSYVLEGTALKAETFTPGTGDFGGELVTDDSTKLFEKTKYFHFVARHNFLQITFQDAISGDITMLGYFQTYAGVGKLRGHGSGTAIWAKTEE